MKTFIQTSKFKKDLKRIQNDTKRILALDVVLRFLNETGSLPMRYKPHLLSGQYKGYMECHIENDLLLIWIDESSDVVKLIRLGSHSELFNK